METIPSTQVFAGTITIAQEYLPQAYEAIANYSADIYDPKSHIVPAVVPSYSNGTITSERAFILFYDRATDDYPAILQPFLDIPTVASTMDFKTVSGFAIETGELVTAHINDVFVAGTVVGSTYDELLSGVQIINDTFYNALPSLYAQVPTDAISLIELDWQPIGYDWISASQANGVNGNPLGLDSSKLIQLTTISSLLGSKVRPTLSTTPRQRPGCMIHSYTKATPRASKYLGSMMAMVPRTRRSCMRSVLNMTPIASFKPICQVRLQNF